jgi:DNA polymerase/3'-5' exonuclease PolX
MATTKEIALDALETLRKKSLVDKEPFKARAYKKVFDQIKAMDTFTEDDITRLQGAGEKITAKLHEIITTGRLKSAELAKTNYNMDALDAFQKIYGVGPVKAQQLIDMGITSIVELRQEAKKNRSLLTANQHIGLQYYEPLLERIPYLEMQEHERTLLDVLYMVDASVSGTVVGSYRRGALHSGDIDFLVRGQLDMKSFVNVLGEYGYLLTILAQGPTKCMAISSIGMPRRLDILICPIEEYAYALLYFTGSQQFNIAFRHHALEMGYTMNEHGMKAVHADVPAVPYMDKEEDIFNFLGLRYVKPEDRINGKIVRK